ncbi:hypothetical protein [Colwellia piezophila]|uniref:hypothetical protein n=1 Tax=Colwellia piezophila TaxID=211668 RepID=UPI000373B89D|nr:hypothetical protein [Colwellia piezophila]
MKINMVIIPFVLFLTGCGSIGAYTESQENTQVSFTEYSNKIEGYLNKKTSLKIAQTGLVTGSTLLYAAPGIGSRYSRYASGLNITYSLWINESEVDEVEFAIDKYRHWRAQVTPTNYLTIEPINEYVSEWMNGVTFKFGLYSNTQGVPFLCICYEFNESGICTVTYMIDEKNIEFLADDLQKFKQHSFELTG